MSSLIQPENHLSIFFVLILAVVVGVLGDRKGWFGKVSGVLITIAIGAIATSVGLLPTASSPDIKVPAYQMVFDYIVPISIPLLLFNVNLKRIISESGRLLMVFFIGSIGVLLGAVVAYFLISFGSDTYKIAAVFIGTYTGGSVNFMAVAATFDFLESDLFATVITVDNVFTNLFFMLLFLLPAIKPLARWYIPIQKKEPDRYQDENVMPLSDQSLSLEQISVSLFLSIAIFVIAELSAPPLQQFLGTDISLQILLITILIAIAANIFPTFMERYAETAFALGMFMLLLFLAVIGASCDLVILLQTSWSMILFVTIILFVHLITILVGGKLLGVSLEEILIASAANAGGPSIAAPMAANFGQKKMVTPAILIGIMGYLIGTFLGVGVGLLLQ